MNRWFYTLFLYLISPIILGYFLLRSIKAPEYRHGLMQRLGFDIPANCNQAIIIHCASVGEVLAATPLINKIIHDYQATSIIVTTTTPTGRAAVLAHFQSQVLHRYLPIDWPFSCKRFINTLNPKIVILMETELWPNLLNACYLNNTPVLLANARLSPKSLKKYLKYPKLSSDIFSHINKVAAQYESDKQNFMQLGVSPEKIDLIGSIKFDINISESIKAQQSKIQQDWFDELHPKRPVWLAASIHPKEFDDILMTHQQLLVKIPDLLLIAVPRHPEKFSEFKNTCEAHQLKYISRSDKLAPSKSEQIVVVDTMGEMLLFLGLADAAYIGGSLIERGGHNPIEAIACGVPIFMGPHIYNFSDVCQILIEQHVLKIVSSQQDLTLGLSNLLKNKAQLAILSDKTHAVIEENSGSLNKIMRQINNLV